MKSFPFDSQVTYDEGGRPVYDRGVDSADLAENIALLFTNGVPANPSTNFQVMTSELEMSVEVQPGCCCINGHLGKEESVRIITLDLSDPSADRIDRIVLRCNLNVDYRNIDLYVIKGTPASTPTAPPLVREGGIYDLCLADVYVNSNASYIYAAKITDTRLNTELCGLMVTKPYAVDTTTLYNQYQDSLNEFLADVSLWKAIQESEFEDWQRDVVNNFNSWKSEQESDFDSWEAAQHEEFDEWFDEIKGQLDEDAAGHLQNEINDILAQLQPLVMHVKNLAVKVFINNVAGGAATVKVTNLTSGTIYRIEDLTKTLFLTEPGSYRLESESEDYIVVPRTMNISNQDVMTSKTFKLLDSNGFAYVGAYVGAYVCSAN